MIEYKDLMIGDWVYLSEQSKYPMQVVGIGNNYCYLNFEGNESDLIDTIDKYMMPIEITKELLEKIGFKSAKLLSSFPMFDGEQEYRAVINGCFVEVDNVSSNSKNREWYCRIDNPAHSTIGGFDFQYLHELQNGIRLITKNDSGIRL